LLFCASYLTAKQPATITASSGKLRYSFFRSIEAAGEDWTTAAPQHNIFLQREFLSIVEANPPLGMRFGYIVFYQGEKPIGVALCQIKYFKGDENINDLEITGKDPCFFTAMANWLKRRVAGMVTADVLISGNMLLTGEHGHYFDPQHISEANAAVLLENALSEVVELLARDGIRIQATLIKDIAPENTAFDHNFVQEEYTAFDIQPNMSLHLDPYEDFEGYLAAMTTKYRTRAKRAFKKIEGVEKRELQLADVQRELPRIYALYKEVAKNAGFNMIDLNEDYLLALKRDFSAYFRIFALYKEQQLLAFFTTIQNGSTLEAHFLGYEKNMNHEWQLYLNCLYEIIRIAFESCCKEVCFARTALEIKSSVGATPSALLCYLKQQNSLANRFTGRILDYLKPVEEWEARHPFKD
jgi:Acetyltransferase (GNAT) domain